MDDRFDFLLTSGSLRDGKGLEYIGSKTLAYSQATWDDPNHSYRVWGNDGSSFNSTLTTTGNTMVGATIAQALRDSVGNSNPANVGGHLPVFMDVRIPADLTNDKGSIDFGTVMLNTNSSQDITVSNAVDPLIWGTSGVQDLNYSFSLVGTGFLAPTGTFDLLAGESLQSFISIDTTTLGMKSGILNITDNVTGQQRQVSLNGIVVVPEPATLVGLTLGLGVLIRRRKK
jgi:hypothetical protein